MTILIFFVILALLILSHELGHFLLAKRAGVRVEEFGFGFPPRLFGIQKGETLYSFNLLPLGGFVRIEGEDAKDGVPVGPRSFAVMPAWVKFLILIAGVFFNIMLAFFLLSFGFMAGAPTAIEDDEVVKNGAFVAIVEVIKDSPAQKAGMMAGDTLVRMESAEEAVLVSKIKEVQDFVDKNKGREVAVTYKRNGDEITADTVLRAEATEGEGVLGIAMARIGIKSYPVHVALWEGARSTIFLTAAIATGIVGFFADLIAGNGGFEQVAGPVGIVGMVGGAAELGFLYLINFTALLSINLAVINIIPFPGLDGGRILFLAIEAIKGSPISPRVSAWSHTAGFFILIFLMILITFHDVARIFS